MRLVYLVDETLDHPVLKSQSLAVLARLIEAGLSVDLLVANGGAPDRESAAAHEFLGNGATVRVLSKRVPGSTPLAKARRALGRALAEKRAGRFLAEAGDDRRVLHARGSAMALGGRLRVQSPSLRLVIDLRGDAAAEARFGIGGEPGNQRATLIDRIEARALGRADHVLAVSTPLLEEARARFRISCGATVIPCVADERRFHPHTDSRNETRHELGLGDGPVVVYAGSLGQWHRFDAIVATFARICAANPEAQLLVLTRDVTRATAMVGEAGAVVADRTVVRAGRSAEIARWMSAGDIGLLLRDIHPLNRVACPTKFAEYALSGLEIVTSEGVGDLDTWILTHRLGRTSAGADPDSAAEACLALVGAPRDPSERERRSAAARRVLSIESRITDWMSAYGAALARPDREGK